ncbi:hypothetical protein IWW57_005399 [Coemansia sp. S610]|nr:hypothetical protein IWW57_005399 [Coemansia sp. S610]
MVSPPPGYDEDPVAPKPSSLRRRTTNNAGENSDDEDIFGIRQPSAAEADAQQRANAQNSNGGRQGSQNDSPAMGVAAIAGITMASHAAM